MSKRRRKRNGGSPYGQANKISRQDYSADFRNWLPFSAPFNVHNHYPNALKKIHRRRAFESLNKPLEKRSVLLRRDKNPIDRTLQKNHYATNLQ